MASFLLLGSYILNYFQMKNNTKSVLLLITGVATGAALTYLLSDKQKAKEKLVKNANKLKQLFEKQNDQLKEFEKIKSSVEELLTNNKISSH